MLNKICYFISASLLIIMLGVNTQVYAFDKMPRSINSQFSQERIRRTPFTSHKEREHYTITAEITAYTSSEDETDLTPCIGAGGDVCNVPFRVVACPYAIPFGVWISIDNILYRCWDRMALKNDGKFDILVGSKEQAFEFGRRIKLIKIYE